MSTYPPNMTLRPIDIWPGTQTRERRRSNFSAQWRDTLNLLDRELWHLGKGGQYAGTVLQIAMREQDFRIDGMPRANAVAQHPGVILNIDSVHGALSYPCDTFTHWQDNLRAIALGLEALRKVERYGITQTGQQYRGWRAIESGGAVAPIQTPGAAALVLARIAFPNDANITDWAHKIITHPEIGQSTYKKARSNAHPDRNDGDQTAWDAVEQAAKVLAAAGTPIGR